MKRPEDELHANFDEDEAIVDAIQDALCNCDGIASARYLRYALAKAGLRIVKDLTNDQ